VVDDEETIPNMLRELPTQKQKEKEALLIELEQLREKNRELEELVMVHKDLGIYTSKYFKQRLSEEVKRAERYSSLLSLAMLNVRFTNGRGAEGNGGLKYSDLQKLSKFTLGSLRDTDVIGLPDKNMIGIILTDTDNTGAETATQRLTNQIKNLLFADEECKVNVRVASYPTQATSASELLESFISMLEKI